MFQTYRILSGNSRRERFDRWDEELECLCKLVRDLELEARSRRQRRDREERADGSTSVEGRYGERSHQSGSYRHRDRSREYADRDSISPKGRQPRNAAMDAIS